MRSKYKTIVTTAGPRMFPVLSRFSLESFQRFADVHGYTVKVTLLESDDIARKSEAAKRARWEKIHIIREALMLNDVVVWFDADVIICRTDVDILHSLGPSDYQGLVLHSVPAEHRVNPNTGVWVLRNSEKAFRFLDAVEAVGMPQGRWSDQGAVLRALGWSLGDERYYGAHMPEVPTEFMVGTSWLPIGWNQPHCENRSNPEAYIGRPLVEDPYAIHFMAMTIEDRLKYMGTVTDKFVFHSKEAHSANHK